ITITEGKNRQIHRMAEALGHQVFRLVRLEFAGITAEGLRPGQFRPLQGRELEKLKKHYLNPHKRVKAERKEARERGDDPAPAPRKASRRGAPSRETAA